MGPCITKEATVAVKKIDNCRISSMTSLGEIIEA
jgi:hypothetical protein